MASIQQSLNQLISSTAGLATAGTYLYSQSPEYKARQKEKGVGNINKQFQLQKDQTIQGATPEVRERLLKAGEKGVSLREEALDLAPSAQRLENLSKAEASLKELREAVADAEIEEARRKAEEEQRYEAEMAYMEEQNFNATPQAIAEKKAVQRITAKTDAQRQMLQGLVERFDTLSAKQQRQVLDVAHKSAKKGGND